VADFVGELENEPEVVGVNVKGFVTLGVNVTSAEAEGVCVGVGETGRVLVFDGVLVPVPERVTLLVPVREGVIV